MKSMVTFIFSVFLINAQAKASLLSQNDVSILFPLPDASEIGLLLSPPTLGKHGPLLPRSIYDKLPGINPFESEDKIYSDLRVVSLRIDPCFPLPPPAVGCQAQIRLIWQPVQINSDGKTTALDASIHTFYNFDKNEFDLLVQKLEQLKISSGVVTTDEALTVNPILQKKGLSSVYAKNLFQIVLSSAGEQRLSRITFMQLSGSGNVWNFGGFDISGGSMLPMTIPRVNNAIQIFSNGVLGAVPNYFSGNISPAPQGRDTFNLLIRNSSVIAPSDKDEIAESTMSATRIENPLNHNPHTVDCVSCHTAQSAKLWAINQYPWLWLGPRSSQFAFKSKFNLTNTSTHPEKTTSLRGFGYDGTNPAISQRVINETAKILEDLGH